MDYTKTITPAFEQDGKRKRLVGQLAELHDGNILLHSQVYSTPGQAEQALDRIVYDILTDQAEHGLVDDVPAALEAEGVTSTQIPSWLLDAQAAQIAPVCATCGNDGDCPDCDALTTSIITTMVHDGTTNTPAYRLHINRVIIRTQAALHIPCKLCGGDHLNQHCPSIRAVLFAEPVVMVMDIEYAPFGFAA